MTKENENLPAVKAVDLTGGVVPKDFDEVYRFANLVQKSRLAPKSFDTLEKVAIGILTNMELGRPVITGLQDLAIINGRAGIYGDASLAMVTASGLMDDGYPIEVETGTPYQDDWTFTFTVKRKGGPERVGKWTWTESKKAGFDNPTQRDGKPDKFSPWRRFTRRMMQWKARNYVLRDVFGDVLKGMKTVEDLHDFDGVVDLTETKTGTFAQPETVADISEKILNDKNSDDSRHPDEKPEVQEADPLKAVDTSVENHENWINKRAAGFKQFVLDNLAAFETSSEETKRFASAKWRRLFPTENWPKSEDNQPQASKTGANGLRNTYVETSDDAGMGDSHENENGVYGGSVEFLLTQTDEWNEITMLQSRYPEIYKKEMAGTSLRTLADLQDAIGILENAVAEYEFNKGGDVA